MELVNRIPIWGKMWGIDLLILALIWLRWPFSGLAILLTLATLIFLLLSIGMIENARGRLPNWWALDFVVRQILRMVEAAGSMMCLIGLFTLFLAPTFLPYDYPWGTVIVIIAGFVIVGMTQWVIWGLPPGMRPRVPD